MWEADLCAWYIGRADVPGFLGLSVWDINAYFELRAPGLRRKSLPEENRDEPFLQTLKCCDQRFDVFIRRTTLSIEKQRCWKHIIFDCSRPVV